MLVEHRGEFEESKDCEKGESVENSTYGLQGAHSVERNVSRKRPFIKQKMKKLMLEYSTVSISKTSSSRV